MLFQIIFICVLLNFASVQGELNKKFKLETYFKANWFDAYLFCRDHGMQLATVNTYDENVAINDVLPENYGSEEYENYWISGTDLAEDGNYKWFSTGKAMSFNAWDYDGQPIEQYQRENQIYTNELIVDNELDCVEIRGGINRWASTNCSTLNYFICENV